jgi:AraC family transcriptional regulator
MTTALDHYHARMQRVLDHIDQHLDGDLDLDAVSSVAAFSKFHFHRQFKATFGVSLHRYVQLARLKRASGQLADGDGASVTDIALDAGYEAPDAFARAFRQRLGQSPSNFRKSPDWEPWLAAFGPLNRARSKIMQQTFTPDRVTIREVAPTRVAVFEHKNLSSSLAACFLNENNAENRLSSPFPGGRIISFISGRWGGRVASDLRGLGVRSSG